MIAYNEPNLNEPIEPGVYIPIRIPGYGVAPGGIFCLLGSSVAGQS